MKAQIHSEFPRRQQGAALVVGMILLLVLTLLAISGMNTSTLELQMAGNAQYSQNAFQAAETGLERSMHSDDLTTANMPPLEDPEAGFVATITWNEQTGMSDVPEGGYSMGPLGFKAYHFEVSSTGASERGATATHTQSFYIKGQASE